MPVELKPILETMKSPIAVLLLLFMASVGTLAFSTRVVAGGTRVPTFLEAKRSQKASVNHDKWQPYFERLIQYREEHDGDCNVTEGDLGEWLHEQRRQYHLLMEGKKVRLTRKRAKALEHAGAIVIEEQRKDKQLERTDLQKTV